MASVRMQSLSGTSVVFADVKLAATLASMLWDKVIF